MMRPEVVRSICSLAPPGEPTVLCHTLIPAGLQHEMLNLAGAFNLYWKIQISMGTADGRNTYSQLVLFGQLVHTQNSNDSLERLVVLEDLLDGSSNLVMFLANNCQADMTFYLVET